MDENKKEVKKLEEKVEKVAKTEEKKVAEVKKEEPKFEKVSKKEADKISKTKSKENKKEKLGTNSNSSNSCYSYNSSFNCNDSCFIRS